MRHRFYFAFAGALLLLLYFPTTGAHATDSTFPCDAFVKNADGSWTVLQSTFIEGPQVKVREGAVFAPGFLIRNYDIAEIIAKACPNAQVPVPETTASETPTLSLNKYADANGNIDVRQLTCGHLADASEKEAQLLLTWYSGWYHNAAKKHGINLARLQYDSRTVTEYCKANRDKNLNQVMELMLK
jgi:HdeA/HdeB family